MNNEKLAANVQNFKTDSKLSLKKNQIVKKISALISTHEHKNFSFPIKIISNFRNRLTKPI